MYQSTASIYRSVQHASELSDAHCHLNLFPNPEAVVKEAVAHGMRLILATGGCAKDNLQVAALSGGEIVFGIVGIAPDFALKEADSIDDLKALVKGSGKIIGIGEIGLDYKVAKSDEEKGIQADAFERQIRIANDLEIPIVVHSRGALKETIHILDRHHVRRAMFHFFEGNGKEAKELEERGYLMSVPPVANRARKEAIREIDIKNVVVETDSPVVGKTPMDVAKALEMISKIKGIPQGELAQITTDNLREFFYI
ncbi:MAG: TatD family hydrolase [Candidatus Micrarchaeota archaeon]|nr:TatD family hydrolase [Candidatus Micrarchaeota archaeon]MDE1804541.1 TatD family hydrolase [Candidatus Micrarchaeota archaeon]